MISRIKRGFYSERMGQDGERFGGGEMRLEK